VRVRQANLKGDTVRSVPMHVTFPERFIGLYERFRLQAGDILIGMSGSIASCATTTSRILALQNNETGERSSG